MRCRNKTSKVQSIFVSGDFSCGTVSFSLSISSVSNYAVSKSLNHVARTNSFSVLLCFVNVPAQMGLWSRSQEGVVHG